MNKGLIIVGGLGVLGIGYIALSKRKVVSVPIQPSVPVQPSPIDSSKQSFVPQDAPRHVPRSLAEWIHHDSASTADYAQQAFQLTNQHRSQGGTCGGNKMPAVRQLQWDNRLAATALEHAIDMANRNYFNHNTPEGVGPEQRIVEGGWSQYPVGENIAAGQATPDAVMTGWLNSPGHCVNIFRGEFGHIGIGYYFAANTQYKHFWVQNFGG